MRNLEMIDGNKKKLWPETQMLTSPRMFVFTLIFRKSTLRQKYQATTANWHNWKTMYTFSILVGLVLPCVEGFYAPVKIPPWGKLLHFAWVKLSHCNSHSWGITLAWNATNLLFLSGVTQKYNMYMHFIIIILRWTHICRNNAEKQQHNSTVIHLHNPADTFTPCTMSGWT